SRLEQHERRQQHVGHRLECWQSLGIDWRQLGHVGRRHERIIQLFWVHGRHLWKFWKLRWYERFFGFVGLVRFFRLVRFVRLFGRLEQQPALTNHSRRGTSTSGKRARLGRGASRSRVQDQL